jgi:hypothetical protein
VKRSHRIVVSILCSMLWISHGSAATLHVAPTGSDAGAGTAEQPWATLRHAAQQARPGDVVKVKAGVYRQLSIITNCRGTAEQPIRFEAEGGPVTLDGSELLAGWRSEGGARYSAEVGNKTVHLVWAGGRLLLGPGYRPPFDQIKPTKEALHRGEAVLENGRLYVRLFDSSDPNRAEMRIAIGHCLLLQATHYTVWRGIGTAWGLDGYKLETGSSHNTFSDAELHHHGQGILENRETETTVPSQENTFQRLHIHHIGLTKFEHGIYTSGIRTRVLSCRFDHITGAGIHAYPEPAQGEYDGNVITDPAPTYYPENFQGDNPPEPTRYYSAFICWGNGGHRVTNNVIAGPFGDGISVRSNENWIWNNTIVLQGGSPITIAQGSTGTWVINNILQTSGFYLTGAAPGELDYNAYFGGKGWSWGEHTYATLAELQQARKESHGLAADARFVDAAQGDYRLAPGSPLRDKGWTFGVSDHDIAGVPRPQRGGIDIGAHEAR